MVQNIKRYKKNTEFFQNDWKYFVIFASIAAIAKHCLSP